jgi:hypothetical protein
MIDEEYRGYNLTAIRRNGMWQVSIPPLSVGQIVPKPRGRQVDPNQARAGITCVLPVYTGGGLSFMANGSSHALTPVIHLTLDREPGRLPRPTTGLSPQLDIIPHDRPRQPTREGHPVRGEPGAPTTPTAGTGMSWVSTRPRNRIDHSTSAKIDLSDDGTGTAGVIPTLIDMPSKSRRNSTTPR